MKSNVPEDVATALSGTRATMKLSSRERARLATDVKYLRLFARMEVGWKKRGGGAAAPVAIGLVDMSALPAAWFEANSHLPKALENLFDLFRATLKRCKVGVTTYFIAGGYFELSLARADVAKLQRVVDLHREHAGSSPPYLDAVAAGWKPWADAALAKYEEVMAGTKKLAPKTEPAAKPKPKPKPASKPKAAAAPAARPAAATHALVGEIPAPFQTRFDRDLGWWLAREDDRLPFRANTKGVFFAQPRVAVGFDLRTVAEPKKHALARPPGFVLDGASANDRLAELVSRCDACGSCALSLVADGDELHVACAGCGGMFEHAVFLAKTHMTVEWAARLQGKWRPGDEDILVKLAPAMLAVEGTQAAAAARRVASRLSLRAFAPGESADEALEVLGPQPRLRNLHLWYSGLTDRGLQRITSYATLTHLNAGNNKGVTDATIAGVLEELTALRTLELEQTSASDRTLEAVARLPALERLILNATRITDGGLAALREHPSLREIEISYTKITNAGLKHVATLPKLASVISWDSKNAARKEALGRDQLRALL